MTLLASPLVVTEASAQQQSFTQQFLQNPAQILQQFPNGGTGMISQLREIAIADPKALDAILGLVPNANKDQKTAIGAALGQAAKVVVKTNQAYANDILQAIAKTKDQDVFLAYSGVNPDQGTAAAGGGGAGGGAGGQTNPLGGLTGGTGGAEAIGGGSTPTGQFSYTSGVSGTGSSTGTTSTTSTITTTTISTSTSP